MNDNWNKTMSTDKEPTLLEYRMEQLESKVDGLVVSFAEVKEMLNKLVITQGGVTANNCLLHNQRMVALEDSNKELRNKLDTVNRKIVTWTAIASVILFVISNVAIPYILQNFKVTSANENGAIVQTVTPFPTNYFKQY